MLSYLNQLQGTTAAITVEDTTVAMAMGQCLIFILDTKRESLTNFIFKQIIFIFLKFHLDTAITVNITITTDMAVKCRR